MKESKKESLMNVEMNNKEMANMEYENMLKNRSEEIFKEIDENKLEKWKSILYKRLSRIIKEDCNILNSENSEEDIRIVSNDIPRTRFKEKFLIKSFTSILGYFINYYCTENDIGYKQGLNEIIAPFLFLKFKFPNIPFYDIYNLFSGYINLFAPNYYFEKKTVYSLKNSLSYSKTSFFLALLFSL